MSRCGTASRLAIPFLKRRRHLLTNAVAVVSCRRRREPTRSVIFKTRQTAALIAYSLLLALGLGLGSAYLVLNGEPPFGGRRLGPWSTWPKLGSPEADPYMRAIVSRRGDVPLAVGEGLTLLAQDRCERPEPRCRLRLPGRFRYTAGASVDDDGL